MTQQGVAKALKRITGRFYKDFMANVRAVKEEQVVQLDQIADEAMKGKEDIRKTLGADIPLPWQRTQLCAVYQI